MSYNWAQLQWTKHRTVLIMFTLILQSSVVRCCLLQGMVDPNKWQAL